MTAISDFRLLMADFRTVGRVAAALVALTAVAGVVAAPATQPAQAARPTAAIAPANCVTSACHANVKQYQVLHGPVVASTCDACHRVLDAKAHTFEAARQKAELCTFCHEFSTGALPVVHQPVLTGECLGCHNPHGGTSHALVREDSISALCGRCHESVTKGRKFLHTPALLGECDSCHRAHASKYPKLVDAAGADLCLACHTDFALAAAKAEFLHPALLEGCTRCHEVHGSAVPMALTEAPPKLCEGCHERRKATIEQAQYQHPVVTTDRSCMTCHNAHGSDLGALLSDLPVSICAECHRRDIKTAKGQVVAGVPELTDPKAYKHGPVRDGQCGGCHSMHGGDRPLLLARAVAGAFYEPFSPLKYELCFSCHDLPLAQDEHGNGVTNFRNGDRNLHFIHVTKGERGRNCRVCHATHAGKEEEGIRDTVPFGQWKLPIAFKKTPTGGTCATGCHPEYAYDRVRPAPPPTTAPAERRTPIIATPQPEQPRVVKWSGRDTAGAAVRVPEPDRPTVLLFLRSNQGQASQVLKLIAAVAPPASPRARVLVVLDGPDAEAQARALAGTPGLRYPVLIDAGNALARQLGVQVWPSTLVVQSDGALVAHVGGVPPALALELDAYLDFAARKIDRPVLNQRLAQHAVVGDSPDHKANQYLQVAEGLLDEGKAEQARKTLAEGLKLHANSAPLQALMIRALTQLGQAKEAGALLDRLPQGALPAGQESILRGRVLIARGDWGEARRILAALLAEKSDLGEAHYLLGQVYEHDRDWQKAAQEYRAFADSKGR